jgi:hypothetical protein
MRMLCNSCPLHTQPDIGRRSSAAGPFGIFPGERNRGRVGRSPLRSRSIRRIDQRLVCASLSLSSRTGPLNSNGRSRWSRFYGRRVCPHAHAWRFGMSGDAASNTTQRGFRWGTLYFLHENGSGAAAADCACVWRWHCAGRVSGAADAASQIARWGAGAVRQGR